jgi:integrase
MASVSVNQRVKRKGEPWRVMWRDATGRQRQRTFDKKADADAFANTLERELLNGDYIDPRQRTTTFGAQYESWRAARKVSDERHKTEDSLAKHHVLPRWKDVPLNAIDHEALQTWVNELRTRYSWETVSGCRGIARQVLAAGVRARRIPSNPMTDVVVPDKTRRLITADTVLEPAEIDRLVAAAPEQWWTFLYCSAWIGWRLTEGLRIERRDLNLAVNRLVIRGTKTDAAPRVIPVPEPAAAMLRWHLREFVKDQSPTALVFSEGKGLVSRHRARRILEDALDVAGLRLRGIDYRQLRHTAASLMLAAGVDPLDVSYRLGHKDYSTTANIYTHLMPRVVEAGTAAIERLMRGDDEDGDQ